MNDYFNDPDYLLGQATKQQGTDAEPLLLQAAQANALMDIACHLRGIRELLEQLVQQTKQTTPHVGAQGDRK